MDGDGLWCLVKILLSSKSDTEHFSNIGYSEDRSQELKPILF